MFKRSLLYAFAFALLIAAIAIAILFWQLQSINDDLTNEVREHAQTVEERDSARTLAAQREQQLETLKSHITANARAEAKLRAELTSVQTLFSQRLFLIEKLIHENETIRQWANEPLPTGIVCLRQRPILSGADAYRVWLSTSRCLPTTDNTTDEQR